MDGDSGAETDPEMEESEPESEPEVDPCPGNACEHDAELHSIEGCTFCNTPERWFCCEICSTYCGTCGCPGALAADAETDEEADAIALPGVYEQIGKRPSRPVIHASDVCGHGSKARRKRMQAPRRRSTVMAGASATDVEKKQQGEPQLESFSVEATRVSETSHGNASRSYAGSPGPRRVGANVVDSKSEAAKISSASLYS